VPGLFEAVTREQVHAATRRVLQADRASVVVAGPYDPAVPSAAGA
jgi:predicted Zn-dependent peptidase